jgi:hypothetical protein
MFQNSLLGNNPNGNDQIKKASLIQITTGLLSTANMVFKYLAGFIPS